MRKNIAHQALFLIVSGALIVFACKREQQQAAEKPALVTSDTPPEEVVRLYKFYLDRNMFAEAKALSTVQEQLRLDEVMRIVQVESQDSTWLNSTFLKLNCNVRADTAECACKIRDQDYTYTTTFLLLRIDGRWLVDAPDDDEEILFEEEEIEAILDSLLNQGKK